MHLSRSPWLAALVTAVAALGIGLMILLQSGATGAPTPSGPYGDPAFNGLDQARQSPGAAGQKALDDAGAPRDADTSVVRFANGTAATVARTPDNYYLALEAGGQLLAEVTTPMYNLRRYAGTYVTASTDNQMRAAIVVPDGVPTVTVVTDQGEHTEAQVTDNVAVASSNRPFSATFDYQGKTVEVFPLPPKRPVVPEPSSR